MPHLVLDIGNCGPDHAAIKRFLTSRFDCLVHQADALADAQTKLAANDYALVLVNRKLDIDYSDGVDVIRQLKTAPATSAVPMMLVTNYPEHQEAAVALGALHGFGKLEMNDPAAIDRIAAVLGE
ncbi:MAG: hypothetical protein CMJ58_06520 [Planctomycetaceae bacterium]|nr:hypothetical protein [Planctomycetaceae bacterium]